MVSRGLVSFSSLLQRMTSGVGVGPARYLYASNARPLTFRPVSYVLGERMSSSSTESGIPMMHHVSAVDRFTLIATRTMKPPIPAEVTAATMERANSRRRIGVNGIMIIMTLTACIYIIKSSQKGREEQTLVSLHEVNMQRYEKLRQEDAEAAAAATAKANSGK